MTYCFFGTVYVGLTNECNAELTMLAANGPSFTFPDGTGFSPLPESVEPTSSEVVQAILSACSRLDEAEGAAKRDVVFAGLGEPLLRLPVLLATMEALSKHGDVVRDTRLNTNGLVPTKSAVEIARALKNAGLSRACVQLQSADTNQHAALVKPRDGLSLQDACQFVQALVAAGIPTECTAVGHPNVDTDAVARLTEELGAEIFKVRPYFP